MSAIDTASDTIHAEVERELSLAGVRKMSQFGWLNANDPDPDYIGHAKWHTDPPFQDPTIFNARAPSAASQPAPPDWVMGISVAGTDFESLMEAARKSIGLLLVSVRASRNRDVFYEDAFIDLHRMSALIYLSTASERLRELFIAAAYRVPQDSYIKSRAKFKGESRGYYATVFAEVAASFPKIECISRLQACVAEICAMRDERNTLIHEVATAIAIRERETQQVVEDSDSALHSFDEVMRRVQAARTEFFDQQSRIVESLIDRYSMLIKAIGEAFDFENQVRQNVAPLAV